MGLCELSDGFMQFAVKVSVFGDDIMISESRKMYCWESKNVM